MFGTLNEDGNKNTNLYFFLNKRYCNKITSPINFFLFKISCYLEVVVMLSSYLKTNVCTH